LPVDVLVNPDAQPANNMRNCSRGKAAWDGAPCGLYRRAAWWSAPEEIGGAVRAGRGHDPGAGQSPPWGVLPIRSTPLRLPGALAST